MKFKEGDRVEFVCDHVPGLPHKQCKGMTGVVKSPGTDSVGVMIEQTGEVWSFNDPDIRNVTPVDPQEIEAAITGLKTISYEVERRINGSHDTDAGRTTSERSQEA